VYVFNSDEIDLPFLSTVGRNATFEDVTFFPDLDVDGLTQVGGTLTVFGGNPRLVRASSLGVLPGLDLNGCGELLGVDFSSLGSVTTIRVRNNPSLTCNALAPVLNAYDGNGTRDIGNNASATCP
jgi:hypothetical protein